MQRFRQRGQLTTPVYKDNNDGKNTVVVTYLPWHNDNNFSIYSIANHHGAYEAHQTIRLQLDHMRRYACRSSQWPNPRLPNSDAQIWETCKRIVRRRTVRRRNKGYQRVNTFDWDEECIHLDTTTTQQRIPKS